MDPKIQGPFESRSKAKTNLTFYDVPKWPKGTPELNFSKMQYFAFSAEPYNNQKKNVINLAERSVGSSV